MALVLVIEPDSMQAGVVKRVLRERVGADCVLADSKDAALASLHARIPDLILVSALLSPRDEADLSNHLRDLEDAEHLQTLTIPLLATGPEVERGGSRGGLFGKFKKQPATSGPRGCDPAVFADEIRTYLDRSTEMKTEIAVRRDRERREAERLDEQLRANGTTASSDAPESRRTGSYRIRRAGAHRSARQAQVSDTDSPPLQSESAEGSTTAIRDPFDISGLSDLTRASAVRRPAVQPETSTPETATDDELETQHTETGTAEEDQLEIQAADSHEIEVDSTALAAEVGATESTAAGGSEEAAPQVTAGTESPETAPLEVPQEAESFQRETEQQAAARREEERLEAERRLAAARLEMQRLETRRDEERQETERLETARREAARLEAERCDAEKRLAAARAEADQLAAARREDERLETERRESARREAQRREAERREAERLEAARRETERIEAEQRAAEQRREAERLEIQRLEAIRREAERLQAERREASQREAERLEAERREAARQEAARAEAELRLAARLEAERQEAERLEAVRREAARQEEERLETVRREGERLEALRLEVAKREAERLEIQRVEAERRLEEARREAERVETERLEAERLKAEAQRLKEDAKRLKAEKRAARQAAREKSSEPAEHSSWIGRAIDALRTDIQRLHKQHAPTPEPVDPPEPAPAPLLQRSQAPKPGKKPKPPVPEQDEWGLYDPAQCGFDALYARLDQAAQEPDVDADEIQFPDLPAVAPAEDFAETADWVDIPLSGLHPSQPLHERLQLPTKASGLAPLAMWAHADNGVSPEVVPTPKDELIEIIARLHLPSSVAADTYPKGCRIRRVRVIPQKAARKTKSDEPLVILSRKRLQEIREEAEEVTLPAARKR